MEPVGLDMGLGECTLTAVEPEVGIQPFPPQLTVVDGGLTEDFPDVVPEEAQPMDYPNMAMQIAYKVQQVIQSGDQVAVLVINPLIHDGIVAALKELPDEAYPQVLKDNLPISASTDVEGAQLITHSDIERQYLERYFGPREVGGNGVLPHLAKYLSDTGSPVRITIEFLRARYLQEMVERCVPNIVVPNSTNFPRELLKR